MSQEKVPAARSGRRTFLLGLLTGAGVVTALGAREKVAARSSTPEPPPADSAQPILYRRTAESERYYRSLYR